MANTDIISEIHRLAMDAVSRFESFMEACGKRSQAEATPHILSVSLSMHKILELLTNEDDNTVMRVADAISEECRIPQSFVLMLWGSASI